MGKLNYIRKLPTAKLLESLLIKDYVGANRIMIGYYL